MLQFVDYPQFTPRLTPAAVLYLGAFGGTYFRPIYSSVTGKNYTDIHKTYPSLNYLDPVLLVTPYAAYKTTINFFKVRCGSTLEAWEAKNWIKPTAPYGWFQWYLEFYAGRRTEDDQRQIRRWLRRYSLYKKTTKTPVIRQVWLHWAII